MKWPVVLSFSALFAVGVLAQGDPDRRPVAQPTPALVTIDQQPAGRRLIAMPEIEFPLRIQPDCAPGLTLDSLSISIADTRRIFRAKDFKATAVIETTLRIPHRQIGPLAIDEFCSSETLTKDLRSTAHVADAYTASVSMRCAGDAGQTVIYDTLALDITLRCGAADTGAVDDESRSSTAASGNTDEDQDSSLTTRF